MSTVKTIIISLAMALGLVAVAVPLTASAATPGSQIRDGLNDVDSRTTAEKKAGSLPKMVKNIINIMLYVIGAISVVMIVVGGIRYTISAGDSSAVTGAKNTIMYAVVGLVVALLAYAVVNFVLDALT